MRGPIDYIIVGFEGNNFKGEILQALQQAIDDGVIAVLSLGLVSRDKDGNVAAFEVNDGSVAAFVSSNGLDNSLVTADDIAEVGEILEDNSSAGLLVIEQLWAKDLKQALINANGTLLAEGRIHPEAARELESVTDTKDVKTTVKTNTKEGK